MVLLAALSSPACWALVDLDPPKRATTNVGAAGTSESDSGAASEAGKSAAAGAHSGNEAGAANGGISGNLGASGGAHAGSAGAANAPPQSCKVENDALPTLGLNSCTRGDENCCTSLPVEGGTYQRSNDSKFPAKLSSFRLDKYEVTVGRFRRFIEAYAAGAKPASGAGKHAHIRNGAGILGETGWKEEWNQHVLSSAAPSTPDEFCKSGGQLAWEPLYYSSPVVCVNWYEAYAFCIWDDGFLPTEAEWNYAAAHGDEQRLYPWGRVLDSGRACYGCVGDGIVSDCLTTDICAVGSFPDGAGWWQHMDLAGGVAEWMLDTNGDYPLPCADCTNSTGEQRVVRGGHWSSSVTEIGNAHRDARDPALRYATGGFRCARAPY